LLELQNSVSRCRKRIFGVGLFSGKRQQLWLKDH